MSIKFKILGLIKLWEETINFTLISSRECKKAFLRRLKLMPLTGFILSEPKKNSLAHKMLKKYCTEKKKKLIQQHPESCQVSYLIMAVCVASLSFSPPHPWDPTASHKTPTVSHKVRSYMIPECFHSCTYQSNTTLSHLFLAHLSLKLLNFLAVPGRQTITLLLRVSVSSFL